MCVSVEGWVGVFFARGVAVTCEWRARAADNEAAVAARRAPLLIPAAGGRLRGRTPSPGASAPPSLFRWSPPRHPPVVPSAARAIYSITLLASTKWPPPPHKHSMSCRRQADEHFEDVPKTGTSSTLYGRRPRLALRYSGVARLRSGSRPNRV